jgi:hypothetical protein
MFMIETVDEIRHFYQFTGAAQSSYPLSQSRSDPAKPQQPMEFLGLLVIGFLIALIVLPFVALAKASRAKRSVDDLAKILSSLENELRNLRPQTVSAVKQEAPVAAPEPTVEAVPPPIPAITPPPAVPKAMPEPPQSRESCSNRGRRKSPNRPNRRSIGSSSWAPNCSRGSAGSRFSSVSHFS